MAVATLEADQAWVIFGHFASSDYGHVNIV